MKRSKHVLLLIAGIITLGAALGYSIRTNPEWKTFDFPLFLASLRDLDWAWVAPAFLAVYATYFVRALRWQILMRPVKPHADIGHIVSATVIGFGALGILGRAAEVVRPLLIARKENVPFSSQVGVWFLERCLDVLILLAAIAFAVGQVDMSAARAGSTLEPAMHSVGLWVGILMVTVLALLVVLRGYYNQLAGRFLRLFSLLPKARLEALRRAVWVFGDGLRSIRDGRSVLQCLLLSGLVWLLLAASYYALLASFRAGPRLSVSQTLVFMGLVMAGSMLQIPGVGGGLQVTALLALTEFFGVPVEIASAMALMIWGLTFLAVIPPAFVLLIWNGLSWAKLSQLESEAETGLAG